MKTIRIPILHEEMSNIEREFYTYQGLLDILAYLLNENNKEFIDKKIEDSISIYIKLEKLKHQYGEKYKPEGKIKGYTFDFQKVEIVYEVEE